MSDREMKAMANAYMELQGLTLAEWKRVLEYLDKRICSDIRTASATVAQAAGVQPETWCMSGSLECSEAGPREVADEFADLGEVLEIDGIAVVKRQFAVRTLIGDGDDQIDMFDTRPEAEAHLAAMQEAAA